MWGCLADTQWVMGIPGCSVLRWLGRVTVLRVGVHAGAELQALLELCLLPQTNNSIIPQQPSRRPPVRGITIANMTTLADEFLMDAEDSGSDVGADDLDDFDPTSSNGAFGNGDVLMEEYKDDDDDDNNEDDDAMGGTDDKADPEEAKAKIEKMHLAGVRDVRSVAGLMKNLAPVLEVSTAPPYSFAPPPPRL